MKTLQQKMGLLASKLIQVSMESGLSWDESVAALGLAAKGIAAAASAGGDGSQQECVAHARMRFEEAFAQEVKAVVAMSDMSQIREAYGESEAIVANSRLKITLLH